MRKQIITEGIVDRFLDAIINSLVQSKNERIRKAIRNDPQILKSKEARDAAAADLQDFYNKIAQDEPPEFERLRDYLHKNIYS